MQRREGPAIPAPALGCCDRAGTTVLSIFSPLCRWTAGRGRAFPTASPLPGWGEFAESPTLARSRIAGPMGVETTERVRPTVSLAQPSLWKFLPPPLDFEFGIQPIFYPSSKSILRRAFPTTHSQVSWCCPEPIALHPAIAAVLGTLLFVFWPPLPPQRIPKTPKIRPGASPSTLAFLNFSTQPSGIGYGSPVRLGFKT